jgi:hypothetical protein
MKRLPEAIVGLVLLAMLAVAPGATAAPAATSAVVYVSDFELGAAHVQPGPSPKPVPLAERLGYGRSRIARRTPEQQARYLVDLMSRSVLDELHQAGIRAQRLQRGAPLPASGWLVRGAFFEADADGRLHQAVIGAGAGSTSLQVVAAIDQLRAGAPQPLYTIDGTARRGKFPGAVVTLDPYIALGRFALAGFDLDRNVRETAAEIADQVKMRLGVGPSGTAETR